MNPDAAPDTGPDPSLDELKRQHDVALAALVESEERYALVMQASNEGVYDWLIDEDTIYFAPNVKSALGMSPEALTRPADWLARVHPDDVELCRRSMAAHFKGETERLEVEYRYRDDDGNWRWARQNGIVQRDETGRAYRMTGATRDITETRSAQEALRRSEERFRVLVEGSVQGIVIHREGVIVFANQAAADMHGCEIDELVGDNITSFLSPDYVDRVLAFAKARLAGEDVPNAYEYFGRRKDGSDFPVQLMAHTINWSDEPAIQCTLVDITERKRAESRLRAAIENIADGFVLFDANDQMVVSNQRFAEFYPELAHMMIPGTTAEEMFRERARSGAVGEFDIPVEEYVKWRMDVRKADGMPAVHRHADGRWLRTTERRTNEGGIVAISTDVTELKQREQDLAVSKTQAEMANRAKSEFLANMSHELRTPLNAIIGFSDAMKGELLGPIGNERYREYVGDIRDAGTHLLQIINDLLDLSKIEAGKLKLDEANVDIGRVVSSCLKIVAERARNAMVSIKTDIPATLPTLWADERACKQILLNLLSNAVKFTESGGAVTVSVLALDPEGIAVAVSDTGIGIPEDHQRNILEPFTQVDASFARNHEGTGLGLPLTKALTELHGGTLQLDSAPDEGTTVTVTFPHDRVARRSGNAA